MPFKSSSLLFSAVVAFLLMAGCSEQATETQPINLISLINVLQVRAETGTDVLASKYSPFYLAKGWSAQYLIEDSDVVAVAAVSRESVLRFRVVRPADRWLAFDVRKRGKYRGPREQILSVHLGGEKLHTVSVKNTPRRVQILLPGELQTPGVNEIVFRFSEFTENPHYLVNLGLYQKDPYKGVAAYFTGIKFLGLPDDDEDAEFKRDESLAVRPVADGTAVRQAANSTISYVVENSDGGEIFFAGVVEAPADSQEQLELSIDCRTDAAGEWKNLWASRFEAGTETSWRILEEGIPFSKSAGEPLEVRLALFSSRVLSGANMVWRKVELSTGDAEEAPSVVSHEPQVDESIRNVIIIVLDAARPDYFGCYGADFGATPNIDEFAETALLFRSAVASAPYTISSISTLFSGVSPESHGVVEIVSAYPEGLQNMARAFRQKGYFTSALSGVRFIDRKFGITRDCDVVVGLRSEENIEADYSEMEFERAEGVVEEAAGSGKPVFIYAHFLPPHWPYRPPAPFNQRFITDPDVGNWELTHDFYRVEADFANGLVSFDHPHVQSLRKLYLNNFAYADSVVQRFLALLKENGLYEDSLIIITADHGEAFGEHGRPGHNSTVYEEMIRVPLLVRLPDGRSGEVDTPVGLIDVFPTLNDLLGLGQDVSLFEGRSFAAQLGDGETGNGRLYYLRADNRNVFSLRAPRYKLVSSYFLEELFDLHEDPHETRNVIDEYPVLSASMLQKVLSYRALKERERVRAEEVELTEEEEKELRNLGYIQ
jgi:arylsulfatase A-like enzyme